MNLLRNAFLSASHRIRIGGIHCTNFRTCRSLHTEIYKKVKVSDFPCLTMKDGHLQRQTLLARQFASMTKQMIRYYELHSKHRYLLVGNFYNDIVVPNHDLVIYFLNLRFWFGAGYDYDFHQTLF